jgi:hypothetical protein
VDAGVIPDGNGLITGEQPQHDLEAFHPLAILMTVADEDLGAIWGSHEVPHPYGGKAVDVLGCAV